MAVYDINTTRDLLKNRLARLTATTTLDAFAISELAQAQQRLEMSAFKPWFLKTLISNYAIGAAVSTAAPTSFIGEVDNSLFYLKDAAGTVTVLKKRRYDDALDEYPLATTATKPIRYSVMEDGKFYFFPTPDVATYTGAFWYFKADTVPTTGGSANLWTTNATDLLVAEAAMYISKFYLENHKAADVFAAIVKLERDRLENITAWKEDNNISATPED